MTAPLAEAIRVLKESSGGVHVSGKAPDLPRYWRVSRAGGTRTRSVDHMLLLIECWAADSVQAEADAIRVDEILRDSPQHSRVISDWGDSTIVDYPDTDPAVTNYRFQVLGTLHCITF